MKIGVSGANGHLGKAVLKRLRELRGDHRAVGVSRSPQTVQHADEARFGDYDAPDRLPEAYAGLDRLLIIPTIDMGYGVRARQLVRAIDAALIAGVGHIVLMSDVGTRDEPEPHVGAASWVGEQHLIKSATSWTILRVNYFMESYAQEALLWQAIGRLAELGESRVGFVSRDDVAAAAAGILVGAGHRGAIYNATGAEALSVADRAALISKISGNPIEVVKASSEEIRRDLEVAGFPVEYCDFVLDIKRKTAEAGYDIVTGDVERLSGRPPVFLRDVMANYLAAGVG
jgi:NAD(P)H dehydrogenase (quinone)